MLRRIAFFGAVWAWVALNAGCGGSRASLRDSDPPAKVEGDRTFISHSTGVEPLWIQECPLHTDHILSFCGESHRKPSYQVAYTDAYADALGKLRRFIGQKVDARLEPDGSGGYRFQIQGAHDEAITIRGAWEGERWAEIYEGPDGQTHDCYVMIAYPRLEFDSLIGKARTAVRQRVKQAAELHERGRILAEQGRCAEAVVAFERAQTLLRDLKEPAVLSDGTNSDLLLEQVVADLRQAQRSAEEISSTALVVLGLTVDGELSTRGRQYADLHNAIQKWLVSGGVKIRPGGLDAAQLAAILAGDHQAAARASASKGAGVLLVIDLHCDFKTREEGIYYSYASGGLRLIRTADGRELYTADLARTKGGHFSKEQANQKALDNLLKERVHTAVQAAVDKIR